MHGLIDAVETQDAPPVHTPRGSRSGAGRHRRKRRKPRPSAWVTAVCWMLGVAILIYPSTAAWLSQYNQSLLIDMYGAELAHVDPGVSEQLKLARAFNEALSSGAIVAAGATVAVGSGQSRDSVLEYEQQLVTPSGVMARLRIPTIDLDLPIYRGTSEETLLKGLGHLAGTSLPVGGESTRSVITGHRGLASARMFTDLDRVSVGDTFTIEVFGEVLSYRVRDVTVVAPEDTETLHQEAGKDLVTLITCTPLGVNSHRILVTGERVPTPAGELEAAGDAPTVPGFPWWALGLLGGIVGGVAYLRWSSRERGSRVNGELARGR